MKKLEIVLASGSPRRQEMLTQLGVPFRVQVSQVDENVEEELTPDLLVEQLANRKAVAVANQCENALVIGADTIVVLDGKVLGKPKDEQEAMDMLQQLQGKKHQVFTGISVIHINEGFMQNQQVAHRMTEVTMRPLSQDKIRRYVETGDPLDKAGAYGIQGKGAVLIEKISGCYFNVVGMSLSLLDEMLEQIGFSITGESARSSGV
ncbi:septum formation protein [Hazenella coriacea]|uniref:dTTP/UTP pyrophosphatase n=1 Tax=Hazenella coriacea TaxID=1179467 RepID=A0A4R3LDV8_9BACL|nr:septum formation protein [Hazenella coriacea]